MVENMYNKGDLTKYEYVKYAPNNLVPQDMKLDFEEQEAEMEQMNQLKSQVMGQLTPDEQLAVQQDPSLMEGFDYDAMAQAVTR